MANKMQLSGLKEADAVLRDLPAALAKGAVTAALLKSAEVIRAEAARNAPVGEKPHKTRDGMILMPGFLRDHIRKWSTKSATGGSSVAVGIPQKGKAANAWYGFLREKEYGGVHGAATPWLRPAFDTKVTEAVRLFGVALNQEILKAATRLAGKYGAVRKKLIKS